MDKKLKAILAAMSKVTGLSKAEIEAKLDFDEATTDEAFDKALDEVLDSHTKAVAKKTLNDFNDGHKAAKLEVMTEFETAVREKFPDAPKSKKGLALVEQLVADVQKGADGKDAKIDDETVKKHPLYLQLEKDSQKAITEAKQEAENKVKEIESGIKKKESFEKLKTEALKEFDALNPVMPENEAAATKRRNAFIKSLEADVPFEVNENGDLVLVDAKGKRLEDAHGHAIKLGARVKEVADDLGFEYKVAKTDRSSAGKDNPADKKNADGTPVEPKFKGTLPAKGDEAAYMAILTDSSLSAEARTEVRDYWTAQNASA